METVCKFVQNIEDMTINFVAHRNKKVYVYFMKSSIILYFATIIPGYMFMVVEGQLEDEFKYKIYPAGRAAMIKKVLAINKKNLAIEKYEEEVAPVLEEFEHQISEWVQQYPIIMENLDTKVWDLWNAFFYSYTVYTTLGYGEIYPLTKTGRILTILYTLIGLPIFVIFLDDLGKLLTLLVKYVWAMIRRLYYTGSFKKRRKNFKDIDVFVEPQVFDDITSAGENNVQGKSNVNPEGSKYSDEGTLTTPDISTFEVDDEFNLPISVALFILALYISLGGIIYSSFEGWTFFESFYYVFICLSTIGFGDFIPHHPTCEIVSIFYECFGKALMAMCFHVVKEKLSQSFQDEKTVSEVYDLDEMDSISATSIDILDMEADKSVLQILEQEEEEEARLGIKRSRNLRSSSRVKFFAGDADQNPVDVAVEVNDDVELGTTRETEDIRLENIEAGGDVIAQGDTGE